jgi:outer membrane protein OmpA-like peptidoglycan-associated protein
MPPKDTDGDGVVDDADKCPDVAGKAVLEGCPDADGDGIADKDDKCKDVAGVSRYDGCPVPDTDGDGLNDEIDKCKTEKGLKENEGCPIQDKDADGVADTDDKCPDTKGSTENNGCPLPLVEGAELVETALDSMTYRIYFDINRALLLPDAFKALKRIVDILKADNSLQINITGHADTTGTNAINMSLSAERAHVTRDYFLSYYIGAARIKTSFYGSSRPVDNTQQWRNRRVEVTISKK